MGGDVRYGPSSLRIETNALPGNFEKGWRKRLRNRSIALTHRSTRRGALSQSFDQRNAERPDVCPRRCSRGSEFGRIVNGGLAGDKVLLPSGADRVAGKVQNL